MPPRRGSSPPGWEVIEQDGSSSEDEEDGELDDSSPPPPRKRKGSAVETASRKKRKLGDKGISATQPVNTASTSRASGSGQGISATQRPRPRSPVSRPRPASSTQPSGTTAAIRSGLANSAAASGSISSGRRPFPRKESTSTAAARKGVHVNQSAALSSSISAAQRKGKGRNAANESSASGSSSPDFPEAIGADFHRRTQISATQSAEKSRRQNASASQRESAKTVPKGNKTQKVRKSTASSVLRKDLGEVEITSSESDKARRNQKPRAGSYVDLCVDSDTPVSVPVPKSTTAPGRTSAQKQTEVILVGFSDDESDTPASAPITPVNRQTQQGSSHQSDVTQFGAPKFLVPAAAAPKPASEAASVSPQAVLASPPSTPTQQRSLLPNTPVPPVPSAPPRQNETAPSYLLSENAVTKPRDKVVPDVSPVATPTSLHTGPPQQRPSSPLRTVDGQTRNLVPREAASPFGAPTVLSPVTPGLKSSGEPAKESATASSPVVKPVSPTSGRMASHPMDETRRSVDISSGQPMVIEDSSGAVPNAPGLSPVQPPSTPSSPSFGAAIPDRPTASIVHTPPSQLNGPAPLFRVNFPRIRVNVAGSSSGVDSLFKNALGPRSTSGFSSRPQSQSHSVASSRSLPQTPSVLSSPPAQEATPSTQVQPLSPAAAVKAVEQANGFPLNDGPSLLHDASTTVASANLAQERRRSMPTVHGLPPPPRPTKTRAIMTGSLVDVLNRRHTLNGNIDVTIVDLTKSDDDDDSNNSLDGDSDGFDLGQFETRLKRIDAHSISSGTKSAPAASNDVSTHATPSSKSVDTLDLASNAATAAPKLTAANPPIPRLDSLRDLMKKRKNRKSSGTLNVTAVPPFAVRPAHPSPIGNQPTQTSTSSSHAAVASVSQQEARGPDAQAGPSAQGPGPSTVKTIPSGTTTPGRLPAVSPPSSAVKNAIIAEQTPDGGVGAPDVDDDEDECAQMLLDPDKSDLEIPASSEGVFPPSSNETRRSRTRESIATSSEASQRLRRSSRHTSSRASSGDPMDILDDALDEPIPKALVGTTSNRLQKPASIVNTGHRILTWETIRDSMRRGFKPPHYKSKDLPHELHDHINTMDPIYRNSDLPRTIFEAVISDNTMEDEPYAPPIRVINDVDKEPCPPWEFYYTNHLWHDEGVPEPDVANLKSCDCKGRCDPKSKTCACLQKHKANGWFKGFLYDDRGRLKEENYPIFECNAFCGCDDDCTNRVVQHGRKCEVNIVKTEKKGWGVFAYTKRILKGTFIGIYAGELLTDVVAESRGKTYNVFGRTYLFDVDFYHLKVDDPEWEPHLAIDAYHAGNFTRFLNHSCDPNCVINACYVNEANIEKPFLTVFATRDILPFEELCFSYNPVDDDDDDDKPATKGKSTSPVKQDAVYTACQCGAANCRGRMWN